MSGEGRMKVKSLTGAICVLAIMPFVGAQAAMPHPAYSRYDDAGFCSGWLRDHEAGSPNRRRCVIAVATTYIDGEENTLPPEKQLLTDDVSRHRIGTEPKFAAGNRAELMAEDSHEVISAIKNRRWTVEGDMAWILYDGYLKTKPDQIGFYVAERITLEKGLIREILVADITLPK
jgi:hypothetical protein